MHYIQVLKPIISEATHIGKGGIVCLEHATPPIIQLLKIQYLKDTKTLSGDIGFLMSLDPYNEES